MAAAVKSAEVAAEEAVAFEAARIAAEGIAAAEEVAAAVAARIAAAEKKAGPAAKTLEGLMMQKPSLPSLLRTSLLRLTLPLMKMLP